MALLLLALLCGGALAGFAPVPASAQLTQSPITKQELEEAEKARDEAAADNSGGSVPLEVWLAVIGLLAIGGATFYMVRDSRSMVSDSDPRRTARPEPITPSKVRGAPKTMFEGEAAPGGRVGKNKKREKAKRQKQARRANRPGR